MAGNRLHRVVPGGMTMTAPDEVRGDHETLLEAVTESGWPTLGQVRGRIVPVLLDTREYRDFYTEGQTTTAGRLMFVTGTPGTAVGVTPKIDDPIADQDSIREEVGKGIIVRTRSDTPGNEALTGNTERLDAALSSGAQIISTDYPVPVEGVDYVTVMPGVPHHRPGRCNPVTAPPECLDEALEP